MRCPGNFLTAKGAKGKKMESFQPWSAAIPISKSEKNAVSSFIGSYKFIRFGVATPD
jgi:hypothetical protein